MMVSLNYKRACFSRKSPYTVSRYHRADAMKRHDWDGYPIISRAADSKDAPPPINPDGVVPFRMRRLSRLETPSESSVEMLL